MATSFYTALSGDEELISALSKVGFTAEDVKSRLAAISEIEKTRANYMLEKGISQNATIVKNKAIDTRSKWEFQKMYMVHQMYKAQDYVFLESVGKDSSVSFKGCGEAIRNFMKGVNINSIISFVGHLLQFQCVFAKSQL